MINLEKYKEELAKPVRDPLDCLIFRLRRGNVKCAGTDCDDCRKENIEWLSEEYKEPEIDWSKVERGTPVLVRDETDTEWTDRYFYDYDADFDCPFVAFKSKQCAAMSRWDYCKLKEE